MTAETRGVVTIDVDGEPVQVPTSASVAAVLGGPGVYCGMGSCWACAVTVDGGPRVRGCVTPVRAGIRVRTEQAGARRG